MGRYEPLGVGHAGGARFVSVSANRGLGSVWLLLAAIGMAGFYWSGLTWVTTAWQQPEYSHGYLIAPIAVYLFLNQLRHDQAIPGQLRRSKTGLFVVVVALMVGLLGNAITEPGLIVYGFVLCIAGLVLTTMGTRRGLRFWAPVSYLIFLLPLPTAIYWQLSIALQLISSKLGVAFISMLGIPVLLNGNVIDLGNYQLQVAEACSGLRYLFPLASFGFLFAVLYKGPVWHKVLLFLSTVPVTVLMNSFRIGVVGVLVDRFGSAQAEGFLHLFEGWIIFVACVVILYGEAVLLQRFAPNRQPLRRMLEIDFGGLASAVGRIRALPGSRPLAIASLMVLAAAIAWHLTPLAVAASPPAREPLVLFPLNVGEWQGKLGLLDQDTEAVLKADDYLDADYSSAGTPNVNFFVAYYKAQTEGSGAIHSPAVCLPNGGWEVSGWRTIDTGLKTPWGDSLRVNRAVIQMGLSRQLVYYWFVEQGRVITDDSAAGITTLWSAVTRGRMDGALVRVITPLDPKIPDDVADTRLRDFLTIALPQLPTYVPS